MSIYPLFLDGWGDLSTWGREDDYLYAQVTRNGKSDRDGPEFWITPPRYPVVRTSQQLASLIGDVTGESVQAVLIAMSVGVPGEVRRVYGLPDPPAAET